MEGGNWGECTLTPMIHHMGPALGQRDADAGAPKDNSDRLRPRA